VLCPFSCRGRSFCPSCEKKRSILWAEWLREEVLEPVPHRHVVLTFHADPLTCRNCGAKLKIVAYLHDTVAIKEILEHLGVSPPEEPKPPPAVHEVVRVPVDEEGREMEAP
jgi:hypothetical protein